MGRRSSYTKDELAEICNKYENAHANQLQIYLDGDQLADLANHYAMILQIDKAQEVIDYGLKLHPGNTDLLIEQAYLDLDYDSLDKAKEIVASIAEDYLPEIKILKAEILLYENKLEEAQQMVDSIEEKDDLDTIIDVVSLFTDMGYPKVADKWLEAAEDKHGEEEEFIVVKAEHLLFMQRAKQAMECYNKLLDQNPYNPAYWMGMAKCYFMEGMSEKCIEACDFALAADEKYNEAYLFKAHSYFYLGESEAAIQYYDKAYEEKAILSHMRYMYQSAVYTNIGDWEHALECYDHILQRVIEINKGKDDWNTLLSDTYIAKAEALSHLEKYEEAHQMCRMADTLLPDEETHEISEGKIYLMEGKKTEAEKLFRKIGDDYPDAEMYYRIGTAYLDQECVYEAKEYYEKAFAIDPGYEELPERLAALCVITNDVKGFKKYNKMASKPFDEEWYQKIMETPRSEKENDELIRKIGQFLKNVQKNKE